MEFFEILRPSECPICGRKHPLRGHGVYFRNVFTLLILPDLIPILRYYCPGCGHTVSFLPSFCVPRKRYSAGVISICFQLIFACGVSLRQFSKAYPVINRVLAGVWLKQWSLSSPGIITALRNNFNMAMQPCVICSGHNSSYITSESLESFFVSSDFVLGSELVSCHGGCDISGTVRCDDRSCSVIIRLLQEKFTTLPFNVRLF